VLSTLSGWEIVLKSSILRERRNDLPAYINAQVALNQFETLPLTLAHVLRIASLPDHHKDPFDRALVAKAQVEGIPILSADRMIARYPVEMIW
jgi:PIN domain nuclease of toxin-antitoxin system